MYLLADVCVYSGQTIDCAVCLKQCSRSRWCYRDRRWVSTASCSMFINCAVFCCHIEYECTSWVISVYSVLLYFLYLRCIIILVALVLTLSPGKVRSIVMSMSVCLSAHVSCKAQSRSSPNFFMHAACGHSSILLLQHCKLAVRYELQVLLVTCFHGTTLYCNEVRQMAAPVQRQTTCVWSSPSACSTGAKCAIYNCPFVSILA